MNLEFALSCRDPVNDVTQEMIDSYNANGVVMLRGALDPEWLLLIELGLQRVLSDSAMTKHRFFEGGAGEFRETVRNFDYAFEIRRLMFDSPIADILLRFMGAREAWYYSDEFFIKDNAGCERTPWHQDTPYYPADGQQFASAWISLDPLPVEECLEFIPGSHTQTMFDGFNPQQPGDPASGFYGEGLPLLPDNQANRQDYGIVSWDVKPGDIIVSSPSTIHGGGSTGPTGKRRALAVRMFGPDVVYATRPPSRPTVPLTPGLSAHLKPGDPLRSPWYPQLRPTPLAEVWG